MPVAVNKIEGPALGIQIDTISFELRLTVEKLEYIGRLARSWRMCRSGRGKDFDSLFGYLSHAATVIRQRHTFLRSLHDNQVATVCPTTLPTRTHWLGLTFSGGSTSFTSGMEVCCIISRQSPQLISTLTPLVPKVWTEH